MDLTCTKCNCSYTKPDEYKDQIAKAEHAILVRFLERQLIYCDTCRRQIESEMITRGLPKVIDALLKSNPENNEMEN